MKGRIRNRFMQDLIPFSSPFFPLHDKTSRTLLACLNEIIRTYGKPKIIRTDSGCSLRPSSGQAWQNGRIERLFGTLKDKLDQWTVTGIAQLNCDLKIFRHWYNHIRPHQNLEGRTPAEAWSGIDPYAKLCKQEYWFEAWDGLLSGYHRRY